MRICIHRGSHQIGGNCIEIESKGARLILDIGLPLDADPAEAQLPASFSTTNVSAILGICVSHPHVDHYGLLHKLPAGERILIGAAARRIINAASLFFGDNFDLSNTIDLTDRQEIDLHPFKITPFLMDHSAYEAFSFLVEADRRRVFYSGDFRGHGRKGKLFDRLLSSPPKDIDVLLLEGTNIDREDPDTSYPTESELERRLVELFRSAKGLVLVWCSGQNIDRIVSVFRACKKAGRQFIMDMYTASILKAIGNPRLPQPGWTGLRVYLPWTQKRRIIKKDLFDLAASFKHWRIYPEQLAREATKSVLIFRPSIMKDLEKANCLDSAEMVYSLWKGYLEDPRYFRVLKWMEEKKMPFHYCHTSGHAPFRDLKHLADAIAPKVLVPVHSFSPDLFVDYFDKVVVQEDGRWWEVPQES